MKQAVISLSGGMDSSALLIKLLNQGYEVTALSFNYGQKHILELQRAKELRQYLFEHEIKVNAFDINLLDLMPLIYSNLVTGGHDVPEGHYEDKNMVLTVVPNRNKIFTSILQSVALSLYNKNNSKERSMTDKKVIIAMGIHAGDHEIYPDCRQEFRDADYKAFLLGNYNAKNVQYYTPYLNWDKYQILKDAEINCAELNISFDEVFKRTNTSYKPIGNYSDYKSASSIERIEAFIKLNRPDPVKYANKKGPVTWETAKQHAESILQSAKG